MKKTIFAVLAAITLTLALPAQAQYAIDYQSTVAAGGAITSPVFDLRGIGTMRATLLNASGAVARVLVFKCLAANGTTALYTTADQSVELSTQETATYDAHVSSVTAEAKQVKYPLGPCARGQFSVAAAGAASATLAVTGTSVDFAGHPGTIKLSYETSVAAGAVVNSPVFDTSKLKDIGILVDNSAGAGARSLTFKCLANDGTTVIYTSAAVSVAETAPGNAYVLLSGTASAATAATRETIYPFPPCKKMSFHIAAAGAAAVGLAVYGR